VGARISRPGGMIHPPMNRNLLIGSLWILLTGIACRNSAEPLWKWSLKGRCYAQPVVENSVVYVVTQAGEIIAGHAGDGRKIWTRQVDGELLGSPAVNGKNLITVTRNGFVYAFDKSNGNQIWKKQVQDRFIAPLSSFGTQVMLPSETGTLYALSAEDGSIRWSLSGQTKFSAGALIHGSCILIGGWKRDFLCLKPDGSINWKFTAAHVIAETAVAHENMVFVSAYDHSVYALDIQTGRMLWQVPATEPSNLILLKNELLFVSGKDLVTASIHNGKVTRRLALGRTIQRIYPLEHYCLAVSEDVYRIDPLSKQSSLLFRAPESFFRLVISEDAILASDNLYSVYGYANPE